MPERPDLTRDLIAEIDARLRDAERLRNHVEQRQRQRAVWPDRRQVGRTPELEPKRPREPRHGQAAIIPS